jgi:hypothetical protein
VAKRPGEALAAQFTSIADEEEHRNALHLEVRKDRDNSAQTARKKNFS